MEFENGKAKRLKSLTEYINIPTYPTNFPLRGESLSGLKRHIQCREITGLSPTGRLAGFRDTTLLQGSRWPSGRNWETKK